MWLYWSLFLWPVTATLTRKRMRLKAPQLPTFLFAVVLALFIGLRFRVGMDWDNYLDHLLETRQFTRAEALASYDPAYALLSWIAVSTGNGIWFVNLGCAIVFVSGLVAYCRRLPNPWLGFVVAVPYMAIVMAMNYTRQGAAFGLILWAFIALEQRNVWRFALFVLLAALFHKPAAALMPLGALVAGRNWVWVFLWISLVSAGIYYWLLADSQAALIDNYFGQRMRSGGGAARVAMNTTAAVAFLALRNRFDITPALKTFWTRYSYVALLFVPAIILSPSSTAVDRVALYFMPIQLFVFSHLPETLRERRLEVAATYLIVTAYASVLFVWFNFSPFYYAWLPYRFYPFEVQ